MNTYMLLLYADEKAGAKIPASEMAGWMDKMNAYAAALEKAGAHVGHGALGTTADATTVNLDPGGEMQVHDGPFAETREQLGGYYTIRAADMEAAQRWAAQCPGAIWGHIEIRQVSYQA